MPKWAEILDALGDDRRIVIQRSLQGGADVRIEDIDPKGYRHQYTLTAQQVAQAKFDIVTEAMVVGLQEHDRARAQPHRERA